MKVKKVSQKTKTCGRQVEEMKVRLTGISMNASQAMQQMSLKTRFEPLVNRLLNK